MMLNKLLYLFLLTKVAYVILVHVFNYLLKLQYFQTSCATASQSQEILSPFLKIIIFLLCSICMQFEVVTNVKT